MGTGELTVEYAFGSFFKATTGEAVSEADDLRTITQKSELILEKKINIVGCDNNLVAKRGNVFPYTDKYNNIDNEIDAYLLKTS